MRNHNLSSKEIDVLKHLYKPEEGLYGIADTQESVMMLSMDKEIAGFSIEESNKLRKGIAKKSKK